MHFPTANRVMMIILCVWLTFAQDLSTFAITHQSRGTTCLGMAILGNGKNTYCFRLVQGRGTYGVLSLCNVPKINLDARSSSHMHTWLGVHVGKCCEAAPTERRASPDVDLSKMAIAIESQEGRGTVWSSHQVGAGC